MIIISSLIQDIRDYSEVHVVTVLVLILLCVLPSAFNSDVCDSCISS